MRIIETSIPDINETNIDQSKLLLAQDIINNISPLLNEAYSTKTNNKRKLQEEVKASKKKINEEKGDVERILKDYNRKKKVARILDRDRKSVV